MNILLLLLPALAAWAPLRAGEAAEPPRVVYGADDRRDLYQVADPRLLKLAGSTAALFERSRVQSGGAGQPALLGLRPYGKEFNLCRREPFFEQGTGAFCTGALVAPDVVLTAGHCVRELYDCRQTAFVFGFALAAAGQAADSVPAADVYYCADLIDREELKPGADWALVRLDRPVAGRAPLALSRSEPVAGAPLLVIGHPSGLPAKVAGGANVRDASPSGYFTANLDTYGGNSGSPVFNAETGLITGVLVRGEKDYAFDEAEDCRVSKVCADDGCRGEDVTRSSAVRFPPEGF
ncbi:MAG: trypsin-like peptidase domain-containing protein [Elusimicrobia bacterium]|nr:trypsin-like peptidase domain-containing protein [Elusimicrobiota bacterium]